MKKTAYITIRTSEKVKTILEEKATAEDRTLSYIINKILTEHIEREEDMEKYEALYQNLIGMIYAAEELDHIINEEQRAKLLDMLHELKEEMDEIE